jgi:hypothetical protein
MRLRIALVAVALAAALGALAVFVGVTAGSDLLAARAALAQGAQRLDADEIARARGRLESAVADLDALPADVLELVPVAGQNLRAVRAVAEATIPVLDAGLRLDGELDSLETDGLLEGGALQVDRIARLREPLRAQADALGALEDELAEQRSGWLVPPLWHELDEQLERARGLRRSAEKAASAARIAPGILGAQGERTYLVAMLNNAELRGAGGILSGVGILSVRDGRLELGSFHYYRDLADDPPYRRVPAPEDFRRHFGRYRADTTRWVAASSSPDVPDVAVVAGRLLRLAAGIDTDGTLLVDPRGLEALMPAGIRVQVPATGTVLSRDEFSEYVYARAYEELEGPPARRDALIGVGEAAFDAILDGGLARRESWEAVGEAAAGGHIRFVSERAGERAALEAMGMTWDLGTPEGDGSLVTVQNYGGNKLDFWARRTVAHACRLVDDLARCGTEVKIRNEVPEGLPRFVYQYQPYGLFKNYVEVYVPAGAEVTGVAVNGEAEGAFREREDGYTAVGVYLEVARGETARVSVGYDLGMSDVGYRLEVIPQPLAHDAQLDVAVTVPGGWRARGLGEVEEGAVRYAGALDERMSWTVAPSDATGITGMWDALVRFWNEPVF